jgi:hypothetical protein
MSFKFKYLGKIDLKSKTNLGHESGNQAGTFYDKKNQRQKSHACVPLVRVFSPICDYFDLFTVDEQSLFSQNNLLH